MLTLQAEAAVTIAALMSAGRFPAIGARAVALVERGANPADLREAAYLAALFCGFPRGVAALLELRALGDADSHRDTAPVERALARRVGEATFRLIHRTNSQRQLDMLGGVHPDFADTVLAEAYGRVIAREFLPLEVRELVGVTSLAVQGLDAQLRAHLLGAHNCGAPFDTLAEVLALAGELSGVAMADATRMLAELRARLPR